MSGLVFTTSTNGLNVVLVDVLLSCRDGLKEISGHCSKGKQHKVSSVDEKNSSGQLFFFNNGQENKHLNKLKLHQREFAHKSIKQKGY